MQNKLLIVLTTAVFCMITVAVVFIFPAGYQINTGVGLGLIRNNTVSFILSLLVLLIFSYWYLLLLREKKLNNIEHFAFVLVVAGSLANIFSRLVYGGVVDYIKFSDRFPVFNIADIAITLGIIIIIIIEIRKK